MRVEHRLTRLETIVWLSVILGGSTTALNVSGLFGL